jgi:hypothetical protein
MAVGVRRAEVPFHMPNMLVFDIPSGSFRLVLMIAERPADGNK